jgi:uncharacterized membrane protein
MCKRARTLREDRRGGITIILAASLFMLTGAATVAIDVGSVYLAKRQLQGIADATALAANAGGRSAAEQMLVRSGLSAAALAGLTAGHYARDQAVPVADRFTPDATRANATRIILRREVPLFFARMLVGRDHLVIEAQATAARTDMAAFSIGTGLASIEGGLANALLSGLTGTQLNLSVMDYKGLVDLDIDLLGFAHALQARVGAGDANIVALFDREVPAADIVHAIADVAGSPQSAGVLRGIADGLAGRSVRLGDIMDLGPAANGNGGNHITLELDAYTLLRMVLGPAPGQPRQIDLGLTVPGLTSTTVKLLLGGGEAHSPLLTVTDSHDVVIRTGQTRLYLESKVGTPIPGLLSLRIPLYVELAAAEARLSSIDCATDSSTYGVTLAVTPSVGSVSLGEIDTGQFAQVHTPLTPRPTVLGQLLLGTRITGYSHVALGGVQPQAVHFTPAQIAAEQMRSVSTNDLIGGIAGSLLRDVQLQLTLLGIPINAGPLASAVGGLLSTTAPLLDGVLNGVTGLLGVRIGTADVRVHQMRCGLSTLVA